MKARSASPRVVVVRRPSAWTQLIDTHGTVGQARFRLKSMGKSPDEAEHTHGLLMAGLRTVLDAIPPSWRQVRLQREDLSRFVFEPEDVVVVVGPDGLVANVAKYLEQQLVIGVNPAPTLFDGVLVPHPPSDARLLLRDAMNGTAPLAPRTMVQATLDDGQQLRALNEIFVGHRSHQSARYRLHVGDETERHSSSGLIVSTGTGATGWTRSISRERAHCPRLPKPGDAQLAWFVREAWPSVITGAELTAGTVDGARSLRVISELDEGGVVFGDGVEADHLAFGWGQTATIGVAPQRLQWVG
jgi:hypothetical protein